MNTENENLINSEWEDDIVDEEDYVETDYYQNDDYEHE